MGFEADIVRALKELRAGEGVTPAKLESHSLLMQLLQAESGSDGVDRLKELSDKIPHTDQRAALKNALALDYPALSGPEKRRKVRTTHPDGGAGELPFSTRTHRRREDEGMVVLAQLLLSNAQPELDAPSKPTDSPVPRPGRKVVVEISDGWEWDEKYHLMYPTEATRRAWKERKKNKTYGRPELIVLLLSFAALALVIGVFLGVLLGSAGHVPYRGPAWFPHFDPFRKSK